LLPKKIPEFNFILSAGFTFAGVDTAGDPKLQNISICTPTNYGSAWAQGYQGGEKLVLEISLGYPEFGSPFKVKIMFSSSLGLFRFRLRIRVHPYNLANKKNTVSGQEVPDQNMDLARLKTITYRAI
jgi:hypothetical protein